VVSKLTASYYVLVSSKEWSANSDVKTLCSAILTKTLKEEDKYQIGLTKIFFRAGMLAVLESVRTQRLNELVTLVQKNVRRRIAYKHYQDMRKKTIRIQAWWRGIMARRQVEELKRQTAAVKIQRVARGWMARRKYIEMRQAVIKIQSGKSMAPWPPLHVLMTVVRGHQARKRALEERTSVAIVTLQSLFRGV